MARDAITQPDEIRVHIIQLTNGCCRITGKADLSLIVFACTMIRAFDGF